MSKGHELCSVPSTESQEVRSLLLGLRDNSLMTLRLSRSSWIYISSTEPYPETQTCLSNCLLRIHAWMSTRNHICNMLKTELLIFPYNWLLPQCSPSQWKVTPFFFHKIKTMNPFLTFSLSFFMYNPSENHVSCAWKYILSITPSHQL